MNETYVLRLIHIRSKSLMIAAWSEDPQSLHDFYEGELISLVQVGGMKVFRPGKLQEFFTEAHPDPEAAARYFHPGVCSLDKIHYYLRMATRLNIRRADGQI